MGAKIQKKFEICKYFIIFAANLTRLIAKDKRKYMFSVVLNEISYLLSFADKTASVTKGVYCGELMRSSFLILCIALNPQSGDFSGAILKVPSEALLHLSEEKD